MIAAFVQTSFVGPLSDLAGMIAFMARTSRPDPGALDRILRQQIDVIARHQALAIGVTPSVLRHRLRTSGPWRNLLPGIYLAATGVPTTLQQEIAALLYAGSGSVITGPAALRCHHIRGTSSPERWRA